MKKKLLVIFSALIFLLTSCYNKETDIDDILEQYRDPSQFAFWDIGTSVISYDEYKIKLGSIEIEGLLHCDKNGIMFYSTYEKSCNVYFYSFDKKEYELIKILDGYWIYPSYDDRLYITTDEKIIIYDVYSLEIVGEIEDCNIGEYYGSLILGVDYYGGDVEKKSYVIHDTQYSISIDDIINNNNLGNILNNKKFYISELYRYQDEFYISINYKYSLLNREKLVFKIDNNYFYFVDYYHYTVDNVNFIRCS